MNKSQKIMRESVNKMLENCHTDLIERTKQNIRCGQKRPGVMSQYRDATTKALCRELNRFISDIGNGTGSFNVVVNAGHITWGCYVKDREGKK